MERRNYRHRRLIPCSISLLHSKSRSRRTVSLPSIPPAVSQLHNPKRSQGRIKRFSNGQKRRKQSKSVGAGMTAPVQLYLVRHGHANAGFAEAYDPGLDDLGREQALAIAQGLAPLGPFPILTSPLKRARETTTPLAVLWK